MFCKIDTNKYNATFNYVYITIKLNLKYNKIKNIISIFVIEQYF